MQLDSAASQNQKLGVNVMALKFETYKNEAGELRWRPIRKVKSDLTDGFDSTNGHISNISKRLSAL